MIKVFFTWLGSVAVANIMHSHFVIANWRPILVVVKFCGTTQSWFDCKCCRQKLCATWAVNCTYISSTSIVQYKKYCMQLVCVSYHVCNCMPSDNCLQVKSQLCAAVFDKSCVRLCMWLHVCICVHLCGCARMYAYVSLRSSYIKKKPSWISSFYSEMSAQTYKSHVCVWKKIQTVKI